LQAKEPYLVVSCIFFLFAWGKKLRHSHMKPQTESMHTHTHTHTHTYTRTHSQTYTHTHVCCGPFIPIKFREPSFLSFLGANAHLNHSTKWGVNTQLVTAVYFFAPVESKRMRAHPLQSSFYFFHDFQVRARVADEANPLDTHFQFSITTLLSNP